MNMMSWQFGLACLTFVAAVAVTWLVKQVALRRNLLDAPNERSAHVRPTPRLGGMGIMAAFVPAALTLAVVEELGARVIAVVALTALVAIVGLVDDLHPLRARTRFGAQVVLACAVVFGAADGGRVAWSLLPEAARPLAPVLSVLWIVWLTNLYNFMDGIDGLAGGQAVLASAAIAVAAFGMGVPAVGGLAVLMGAAAAGFLVFNFPPASIFMGDVGSTALGFFFASLPLVADGGRLPVEVVGLALALFILDATTTLVRRLARGERFYQAHRSHWYQRPLTCGVHHRAITLTAYAGMLIVGVLATRFDGAKPLAMRVGLVGGAVLVFLALVGVVLGLERRSAAAAPRPEARA
ncbi:glycosyl transferase family 4 [Anaeromyxobacter dehalogenans 2CP-1]|uniref:Glycosyl transferase family 4 n=1 Tax=Anaeromyxobacter dehalogenans (strain ATCC BAA-258 / DSM 21875 / 2CP-1) TaxID=455488 RepID=B8JCN1_ANAD2|nr:glycosyltransferase family 4 protein [Anaeromyxobacter dehalogenans]ACL67751.1 glycosyl transferase family 4 [Anaeromyxobacter dehalogenans 2CP-1]